MDAIQQLNQGASWRSIPFATRVDVVLELIRGMAGQHGGRLASSQYNAERPPWAPSYPHVCNWLGVTWSDLRVVSGCSLGRNGKPPTCECGKPAAWIEPILVGEQGWETSLLLCNDCARALDEMGGGKHG